MNTPHKRFGACICVWPAVSLVMFAYGAFADAGLLGKIDFPNSGTEAAQADFIEGMLYMHNFEYDEANAAFKRAQEIDPDFAMAYWGEAMTYHHPLWNQQTKSAAEEALMRLGRTREARAAKAGTQRERDYLGAVETLFGMTEASKRLPKSERDVLYRDEMRRMHETYPDDHEATTLYGLSILGVGSVKRDYATYMRAAAVLTEVWDASRMHPGAAHYLIHSYDDPIHAPLGLPMARAYSKIAPGAAHAQHMTSHIFVALGMWEDLVNANEIAIRVENEGRKGEGEGPLTASHYVLWLEYGYLQQGRYTDAERLMRAARARLEDNPRSAERAYYGTMYARYMFDREDWSSADAWAAPEEVTIATPNYHFALAAGAIENGDLVAAREHMRYVTPAEGGSPEAIANAEAVQVLRKELDALFAFAQGDSEKAVALAREALADALSMPYKFGPPFVVKPPAELLGDVLLELGRTEEAVAAYKDQLTRTPRRANTLLGLARAAKMQGDEVTAADAYRQLKGVWRNADVSLDAMLEALAEARAAVEAS